MDDTVVMATSHEKMSEKLALLKRSADEIGMVINSDKSQFLVVGAEDRSPFILDDVTIAFTSKYNYLGTWIFNDSISNQVKEHIKMKNSHCLKFAAFLSKNSDAPYSVKRKVWQSALMSAVFYSCESWLTKDLKVAECVYNASLKQMLSVRVTTCTDLVMVEAGESGAKATVRTRQHKFLVQIVNRASYKDSYLESVMNLAMQSKSPAGQILKELIENSSPNFIVESVAQWKEAVQSSESTRRSAYKNFNPLLSLSPVYFKTPEVPEHERIAFSRIRLSSHDLSFEKGRWSRIPPNERLCPCGEIQTDSHVLLHCNITQPIKDEVKIHIDSITRLFMNYETKTLCKFCSKILTAFA